MNLRALLPILFRISNYNFQQNTLASKFPQNIGFIIPKMKSALLSKRTFKIWYKKTKII